MPFTFQVVTFSIELNFAGKRRAARAAALPPAKAAVPAAAVGQLKLGARPQAFEASVLPAAAAAACGAAAKLRVRTDLAPVRQGGAAARFALAPAAALETAIGADSLVVDAQGVTAAAGGAARLP